ncbi:MAG: hypothetical protein WD226_10285 [Planctomycetota bacterium]
MARDLELDTPKNANVTLGALRASAARFPLWIFAWGVVLLAALPFALVWQQAFIDLLGQSHAPGAQLAFWTEDFRYDHAAELKHLRVQSATAFAVLALVAQLAGVFFAGGWLQVFLERTSRHPLRRFLWGGARTFWRFLRLWLVVLALVLFAGWLFYGDPWNEWFASRFGAAVAEDLTREDVAFWWGVLPAALFAATFALVSVWATYARARMALLNKRSVFLTGLASAWMILRHPLRSLRPLAALLAIEFAVIGVLGFVSHDLNRDLGANSGWKVVLVLFALSQLALLVRSMMFGARYAAAVSVCRALIRVTVEPDPFADRVGGPGGPQYPIDDSDEYGVSY